MDGRGAPAYAQNCYGTTGRKKDPIVSSDETMHETMSPEQDHSTTSARSNDWAECRDKKVSAPSRRSTAFIGLSGGDPAVALTSAIDSGINNKAAVAATRGDLGQLAPRKKLLKSFSSFPEDFLRPSEHFGTEGLSFLPSLLP